MRTLASVAAAWNANVAIIPTVVDTGAYSPAGRSTGTSSGRPRVGWLGSQYSIRQTLFAYVDMLAALQNDIGFEFVVVSGSRPELPGSSLQWRFVRWSPTVENNIADLFDIGIMPLLDDPLQRAKCGAKLLQYMAAGLPVIASPVGVNRSIVKPGETGFLAADREGWGSALRQLAADPALRRRLGAAGRARAEADYSVQRWLPAWLQLLDGVARER